MWLQSVTKLFGHSNFYSFLTFYAPPVLRKYYENTMKITCYSINLMHHLAVIKFRMSCRYFSVTCSKSIIACTKQKTSLK